jgi:heme-degrading monooxygenase HmoA
MIARSWHGAVPREKGDAYHQYVMRTGVADLRKTPGNRGVLLLRHTEGDRAHFQVVSFWDSFDQIRAFAGDDIARARYYQEDREFLLELEPTVTHHEVLKHPGVDF